MAKKEPIIISLGGALIISKEGIDTNFLKNFNNFIRRKVARGGRFFIVVGGGITARVYRDAGQEVIGNELTADDLDWLGIHATRLNAHLVRTIFRDIAHPKIIHNYEKKHENITAPLVIAAGGRPGWSTDYDAVILARDYKAEIVINLSNVTMVCDKDPAKYKEARPIKKISWRDFRNLIGDKWTPGLNVPFDPVASRLAEKLGLKVIILDGKKLANLEKCLEGKNFVGTTIT